MRFSSHYAEWIDDVTRVRALKVYKRHTQATSINSIDFIDYVVEKWDSTTRVARRSNPRLHSHDRVVRASEYRTL